MSLSDVVALLPLEILGLGIVIIMLVIAFWRNHALIFGLTLATLLLAFLSIPLIAYQGSVQVTPLLIMDGYALFIIGLLIAASFVVTMLSYAYLQIHSGRVDEFYLLLLAATLGAAVLAASSHFVSFFIGLEILSISLYALIGYTYNNAISIEAGVKYLILAASSAAFLLFGMALVYSELGTMQFTQIASNLATGVSTNPVFLLTGFVLILVAFGYKLALVPFHLWTPDVYEGAPAPVTAFVASVSKGSMFALLLRFYQPLNLSGNQPLQVIFVLVAIITMLVGTLLALLQSNIKRLLAYSSIANLGYLLVAFLASGANVITASTFYLVSYFITILAAFGVVTALSNGTRDADSLETYRGLMWRHPWLAAILTGAMFSLAGIPLTVGFIGKFYLVLAGVGSAQWLLVVSLVISSAIGVYYYLRVVVTMYLPITEAQKTEETTAPGLSAVSGTALAALFLLLIWFGVYPSSLIAMIQTIAFGGR